FLLIIYPTTAAAAQRLCLSSRAVKRLRQRKYPDYGKKKNWQPEPVGADKVLQVVKPGAPLGIARGFGHGGMRGQQTVIAHAEDLIPARHWQRDRQDQQPLFPVSVSKKEHDSGNAAIQSKFGAHQPAQPRPKSQDVGRKVKVLRAISIACPPQQQ